MDIIDIITELFTTILPVSFGGAPEKPHLCGIVEQKNEKNVSKQFIFALKNN